MVKSAYIGLVLLLVMASCGPGRAFKQQSASVLDVARQLHWEGCEAEALLQEDLCENAYAVLVGSEPGMEDEIAKKRALNELWIAVKPTVIKYAQDGAITAAQLLLAYVTGTMMGGALGGAQ